MAWEDPPKDALAARGHPEAALLNCPHPSETERPLVAAWGRACERAGRTPGVCAVLRLPAGPWIERVTPGV